MVLEPIWTRRKKKGLTDQLQYGRVQIHKIMLVEINHVHPEDFLNLFQESECPIPVPCPSPEFDSDFGVVRVEKLLSEAKQKYPVGYRNIPNA